MALSRKNQRKLNRLRKDADQLWGEQQQLFAKARALSGRAGESARDYADAEVVPAIRKSVDKNIRPAFDRGVDSGRRVYSNVEKSIQRNVIPAVASASGNVTGAVREFVDTNKPLRDVQARTNGMAQEASKRFKDIQAQLMKDQKKKKAKKSGPGVGGWFLIGAGIAAVSAVGYALWQTFRADDDLWIADEELDAPVETVTRNN